MIFLRMDHINNLPYKHRNGRVNTFLLLKLRRVFCENNDGTKKDVIGNK